MAAMSRVRAAAINFTRILSAARGGATRRLVSGSLGALGAILLLGPLAIGCGGSKTDSAARAGTTPSATVKSASRARTWKLVAIGDSLPFGQQDCGGCDTFPELYGAAIARQTGMTVETANLSEHIGLDSDDLRREMVGSGPLRNSIAGADIITVTIGHNDTPWNRIDDRCDGSNDWPPQDWAGTTVPAFAGPRASTAATSTGSSRRSTHCAPASRRPYVSPMTPTT